MLQTVDDDGRAVDISQSQARDTILFRERMYQHRIKALRQFLGFYGGMQGVIRIRLVYDIEITGILTDDMHQQVFVEHIAGRIIGIAEPVQTVVRQHLQLIGSIIGDQVPEGPAGIFILIEGGLRDHRRPAPVKLRYQIDGLIGAIGDHDGILRNTQTLCQQTFQLMGLRFGIVPDHIEMRHQMRFQV